MIGLKHLTFNDAPVLLTRAVARYDMRVSADQPPAHAPLMSPFFRWANLRLRLQFRFLSVETTICLLLPRSGGRNIRNVHLRKPVSDNRHERRESEKHREYQDIAGRD